MMVFFTTNEEIILRMFLMPHFLVTFLNMLFTISICFLANIELILHCHV